MDTSQEGPLEAHQRWVGEWVDSQGGKLVHPRFDALKLLEEVIELCYTSGANIAEVDSVVARETYKALNRGEVGQHLPPILPTEAMVIEVGDVNACLIAYAHKSKVDMMMANELCQDRILGRAWAPDEGGVLRRPR